MYEIVRQKKKLEFGQGVVFFKTEKKRQKKKKKKTKYKSYRIVELKKMAYHQFDNKMWKFKNLNGKGGGRKGGRGDEVNRSTSKVMMQA